MVDGREKEGLWPIGMDRVAPVSACSDADGSKALASPPSTASDTTSSIDHIQLDNTSINELPVFDYFLVAQYDFVCALVSNKYCSVALHHLPSPALALPKQQGPSSREDPYGIQAVILMDASSPPSYLALHYLHSEDLGAI